MSYTGVTTDCSQRCSHGTALSLWPVKTHLTSQKRHLLPSEVLHQHQGDQEQGYFCPESPASQQEKQSGQPPTPAENQHVREPMCKNKECFAHRQCFHTSSGTSALVANHISFIFHLEEQGRTGILQRRVKETLLGKQTILGTITPFLWEGEIGPRD